MLDVLRCPGCSAKLELEVYRKSEDDLDDVIDGLLVCLAGHRFAVWRGVPRMLPPDIGMPDEFRRTYERGAVAPGPPAGVEEFSFSYEWSMYRYGELTWEQNVWQRLDYMEYYIDQPKECWSDLTVLDAGCGNGTLSAAAARAGAYVVGIDYSTSVERAEQHKAEFAGGNAPRIQYVQGDVQHPPFAPGVFDVVYSDGVLHHTDDTKRSFDALSRVVKPGGRMFVWLYRSDLRGIYRLKEGTVALLRRCLRPLPVATLKGLCLVGAVVLNAQLIVRRLLGFRGRRRVPIGLKAVNLFDTFSPKYNHTHTPAEVRGWFVECGFEPVVERTIPQLGNSGFGMLGVCRPEAASGSWSGPARSTRGDRFGSPTRAFSRDLDDYRLGRSRRRGDLPRRDAHARSQGA